MRAVGIVAEYNPFHLGHAWHIQETRRVLGDAAVVCVMSGSWVQRGECALTDKWTRAGLALEGGADLVLELPLPWSISSAEGFASGAVEILTAVGLVDGLSFGSESGDLDGLRKLSAVLEGEEYRAVLRTEVKRGKDFASARQAAVAACLGKKAHLLRGANDSLGVEYLRAISRSAGGMEALAVERKGAAHDSSDTAKDFASATLVRELIRQGGWEDAARWLPEGAAEALHRAGTADMRRVERAVLARLRSMNEADFAGLPDSGAAEGLPARLVRAAGKAKSLEEFYDMAKTRRYAHSRIRRLALWAFLGLTAEDRPEKVPYIRVLGMTGRGRTLLHEMKDTASLPVITKPAHIKDIGEEARRLFELECRGTDLHGLCFEQARPCGADFTTGPVIR